MTWTLLLLLSLLQNPARTTCAWSPAEEVGSLGPAVNESSGMAISRRIPNRSYRINDSGDSGRFYVMGLNGGDTKTINIAGFNPIDTEDMAIGPCSNSEDCIFVGDIGDNARRRTYVELVVIEERADFPSDVQPAHRIRLRYPGGPRDAEGLGVHPDGNVYITTKDTVRSEIFRLKRDQWQKVAEGEAALELVATLDWEMLRPKTLAFTRMVTGMSIAPDGKSFVLLNYGDAMEFFVDLSAPGIDAAKWADGADYRTISLVTLEQEESIAYFPNGKTILYDTERSPNAPRARIMRMECR